jgi:hypothetical protein
VDNQVRLHLFVLAYNLGNFLRQAVLPPIGASLDLDDVAGETDQDRGEGGAPFSQDSLPDGGGGSAARVVPDHFGTDWAAEIGNRDVRMKADHGKTTATSGVFTSGRNQALEPKMPSKHRPRRKNPVAD